ncbi:MULTISPECIES: HDOD domain-containing protein [unclassified Pseudodesulfovibrio]|uniref:HDOD domain-containing protein n=1 Tax=unclassified Pseudodesulfovibrio TaxID=2661612 RepID=UPI000FEBF48A|nr:MULTISPECIES: HDOD domain-containing protein [unclassified Pseudodesulfovibrio]MCJ2164924.1 HDOD domain-containing protein [Pseudodesulfovibrio sp. S3-i]RWU03713.1 HDOD domain-containing protein [Pseudodesulfovibrio sp. S3]
MAVENVTPEKGVDITPETLEAAKKLLSKRFKFIKSPDESLKCLARLGAKRVALDMTLNPERYVPEASDSPLPKVEPLDPLDILRQDHQLPALPQVFLELQQAIGGKATSADDLAEIISQDPGLTAFLLRMVNSAFYSLPMQIDTISRAVTVVGVNQLSTLAVGTSVMSLFKDVPADVIDMEQFWKHSICCGLIARRLCRVTGKGDPERAFVAGLLHDIGQLILLQAEPERAMAVHVHARVKDEILFVEEKALLGFDHATLGGMLLRKWNFPFVLVASVLEHHQPKANQKEPEPLLVHCAETLATGLGVGSSGEYFVQPPDRGVWESMGFTPERMGEMVEDLDEELEEAFGILIE